MDSPAPVGDSPTPVGRAAKHGGGKHGGKRIAGQLARSGGALEEKLAAKGKGKGRGSRLLEGKGRGRGRLRPVRRANEKHEPGPDDPPPNPKDIGCRADTQGLRLPWAKTGGLPPLPTPWNDTSEALPSYQRTRPKRCAILVDRHVHKNGGSTIRDWFLEQERLGHALYQGYTQLYWRQIFSKLQKLFVQAAETGQAPRIQMLIEAHFGWVELNGPIMKDLHSLREVATDCPIVTMTRVREPLDFYLSFYQWGVGFRQRENPNLFGKTFAEWARLVPNLQSTMMLRSMAASDAEYHPRTYVRSHSRDGAGGQKQLLERTQAFLRQFDIVATMSRFDESILMAADMTGVRELLYKRNMPNKKGGFRKTKSELCPDMQLCRDLIKEIAPVDHQMWNEFHPKFEKRVEDLGPSFAARVTDFKAQLVPAQKVWQNALRKQFLCRYHPEEHTRVWKLREENLRCPVEGAAALKLCQATYAYRTFECPWQFLPNTSYTDTMGCWRPSTGFK